MKDLMSPSVHLQQLMEAISVLVPSELSKVDLDSLFLDFTESHSKTRTNQEASAFFAWDCAGNVDNDFSQTVEKL